MPTLTRTYFTSPGLLPGGETKFTAVAGSAAEAAFVSRLALINGWHEQVAIGEFLQVRATELTQVDRAHRTLVDVAGCRCEAGRTQISKLRMNFQRARRFDLMETSSPIRFLVVSARLRLLLDDLGVSGVEFVPCLDTNDLDPRTEALGAPFSVPASWPFFQMRVTTPVLPPQIRLPRRGPKVGATSCTCGRRFDLKLIAARYSAEALEGHDFPLCQDSCRPGRRPRGGREVARTRSSGAGSLLTRRGDPPRGVAREDAPRHGVAGPGEVCPKGAEEAA